MICGERRWSSSEIADNAFARGGARATRALVAEALQPRRRRGGELVKLSIPSGASARRDGTDHDLFQVAGFRFRLRDLIHREIATVVEFAEVRARGGITGVLRNGVPDVGSEAIKRNAAPIFQRFGIEVLLLGKALIGGNLIELGSLGVISIRHQTAQVVGAEGVVLVGGDLE